MRLNFKRKKFEQFLEEKGFQFRDENYNESIEDIFRSIGGLIGGARRGMTAGQGTPELGDAEEMLQKQMTIAIDNYAKNLVRVRPVGATPEQQKHIRKFLTGNLGYLIDQSLNSRTMKRAYDIIGTSNSGQWVYFT